MNFNGFQCDTIRKASIKNQFEKQKIVSYYNSQFRYQFTKFKIIDY